MKPAAFVLDCSVAVSWVISRQATPETDALWKTASRDGICVPSLWHVELANSLLVAERRKSVTEAEISHFFAVLDAIEIQTDDEIHLRAHRDVFALAREYKLTAYDATYLELAMRMELPLATRDADLRRAAKKAGVSLV